MSTRAALGPLRKTLKCLARRTVTHPIADLIGSHQLHCARAQQSLAIQLAAVLQHLLEKQVVAAGAMQAARSRKVTCRLGLLGVTCHWPSTLRCSGSSRDCLAAGTLRGSAQPNRPVDENVFPMEALPIRLRCAQRKQGTAVAAGVGMRLIFLTQPVRRRQRFLAEYLSAPA